MTIAIPRSEHGLVPPPRDLAARMFVPSLMGGCLDGSHGTQTGHMTMGSRLEAVVESEGTT